jgi:hypothetical protein
MSPVFSESTPFREPVVEAVDCFRSERERRVPLIVQINSLCDSKRNLTVANRLSLIRFA